MAASLANVLVSGLLTGLVYGLAALGLSVIFGVVRIVNFAHGEMMVLGMYLAVVLAQRFGLDPLVAAPIVAALLFAGGWALQRGLVNRLLERSEPMQFILMAGIAMVLVNAMLMAFGPDAVSVQVDYSLDTFAVGPLIVDKVRLYAAAAALAATLLLYLFFRFSRPGKAIRAAADNRLGARVVGLNVEGLYALTFGIGAATVGVAGCLMTLIVDARPQLAADYTLLSFVIVIVGGLGSPAGALAGGVLIGVSEALAGFLFVPAMKSMVSFALLILVLVLRPQGLLGRRA